jgi:hypothetical protein
MGRATVSQLWMVLPPHSQVSPCGPHALPSPGELGGHGDDPLPSLEPPASLGVSPSPDAPPSTGPWVVPPHPAATATSAATAWRDLMHVRVDLLAVTSRRKRRTVAPPEGGAIDARRC